MSNGIQKTSQQATELFARHPVVGICDYIPLKREGNTPVSDCLGLLGFLSFLPYVEKRQRARHI